VFCDVVLDEIDLDPTGECVYPPGELLWSLTHAFGGDGEGLSLTLIVRSTVAGSFVNSLGTAIRLPDVEGTEQPQIRPMTPGKPPKVDLDRVRQNLHELWVTEESYLRKIKSLLRVSFFRLVSCFAAIADRSLMFDQDYALPLRSFSRKRETAIIPQFEATHLFINIEQLVPIAEAFERDLRAIDGEMRRDRSRLPSRFGETILSHVRFSASSLSNPFGTDLLMHKSSI
jgi:hypothetical protein